MLDKKIEGLSHYDKAKLLQALKEELGTGSRFDTDEWMELSLMWARGEVTSTVIRDMVGNNNYSQAMMIGLRRAVKTGRLVEKTVEGEK